MTDPIFSGSYDSQDDIPETVTLESVRDLFVERDGKFELAPGKIPGIASAASVTRLETAKARVAQELKEAKEARESLLSDWGDLKPDEVRAKLDRIEALEAAAEGKLDDEKIEELTRKRVEAQLTGKLAPKEREVAKLTKERDELLAQVELFQTADRERKIGDATRVASRAAKVLDTAEEDALFLAQSHLEIREDDGAVVTREGITIGGKSIPAGLDPAAWLAEIQDSRPHWWPTSQGGGARGSGGGAKGGVNPWKLDTWSGTEQARITKERGIEAANRLAAAVGLKVGDSRAKAERVARQTAHGARQ